MQPVVTAARAVLGQPASVAALLVLACLLGFLAHRWLRLGRIIVKLRALPAAKRRYVLEREFHVYPGKNNRPIAFVRRLRKRYRTVLVVAALGSLAAVIGLIAQQSVAAGEIQWSIDDSALTASREGYHWRIEIRNLGSEPVRIDHLVLRVVHRARHSEKIEERPNYGPVSSYGTVVKLDPDLSETSVLAGAGQVALPAGSTRILRLHLIARHPPLEGWTYDVRLQGRWRAGPLIGEREWAGSLYRIGWPGMPRWYRQSETEAPNAPPVTDPPHVVD